MEQRAVARRSAVVAPVVGMGTWKTFDVRGAQGENQRHEVVDAALESNVSLFDSSPMYGEAERVLGLALRGRREQALIATKVWTADDRQAQLQIERALGFFDGRIDLYQVHNLVAWQRRLDQLERLREQG